MRGYACVTDPDFPHRGEYACLGCLPKPALAPEEPPRVDGIVPSHPHGTPPAARRLQALHGFRWTTGLRTWQALTLDRVGVRATITALPGRHAGRSMPYEDYTVMCSPPSAFLAEAGRLGLGDRIIPCPHGGRTWLPAGPGATPMVR
ncbi:hypothetical protein [Streptomyces achromogenes]|uniref:hypothetical protein n=1 Tax=Streptomyces achromogenes TaxID=67255 RepID=UPI0036C2AFD9